MISLIAYDGKKPVGFMLGHIAYRVMGKPKCVGVADELYVVPEKRGDMVGIRLLQEGLKWAIKGGAEGIEAVANQKTARERWERLGFVPYTQQLYISIEGAKHAFMLHDKSQAA